MGRRCSIRRALRLILPCVVSFLASACDPYSVLDRVTIAFTPQTEELEVALWLKRSLKVPVGAELQSIAPWGMLKLLPTTLTEESAQLILRLRPTAFDDSRIHRMPFEQFTTKLPNEISHGIGEELVALTDGTASAGTGLQLTAYIDAYMDSAQWMGAAVAWAADAPSPIPPGTTVWFPLKRNSQERVILSVAFYGAQKSLGPKRAGSVAAVFADYQELGRLLGGGTVRRMETLRLGK